MRLTSLKALAFTIACIIGLSATAAFAVQPIRNGYVAAPPSGWSAFLAIDWALVHNKQNNTLAFPPRCISSCAIAWNFAKKRCIINHDRVMLEQHERSRHGKKIDVRSKDRNYWLRLGREGNPSRDMVAWYESAPKCPAEVANKRSGPPLLRLGPRRGPKEGGIWRYGH